MKRIKLTLPVCLLLAFGVAICAAAPKKPPTLTEDQRIRHLLDRIGFGPRPGDIQRVKQVGLDKYIDQQLHPDTITDDATDKLLARLSTLSMLPADLVDGYRAGRPKAAAAKAEVVARNGTEVAPPAAPQTAAVLQDYREFGARVVGELQFAKTVRAVESNRQLQEVMVDFWTNHFNIDVRKNTDRVLKTVDDRDVIRKFALGNFRDLLGASAKSPAMLVYLDNARSTAPAMQRRPNGPVRSGINENYARELMELHTLGVDGGYTQQDVQEVARCFTGWSVNPQTGAFQFYPRRHDDGEKTVLGRKIPAGGGIQDGETVLDILARSPSTGHFISFKLCRRFVSDDPPKSVVDRAAEVFRKTDGDIRAVVSAILKSREFNSAAAYQAKIKSPFEYAVSAVRAVDGHVVPPAADANPVPLRALIGRTLVGQIATLGEPLMQCQPPTGYPEDSRTWVSAGALISRLNFAVALAHDRVPGVVVPPPPPTAGDQLSALAQLEAGILGGHLSTATKATLQREVASQGEHAEDPALVTALILGSPEFQRR